jgi:hypothetical protein
LSVSRVFTRDGTAWCGPPAPTKVYQLSEKEKLMKSKQRFWFAAVLLGSALSLPQVVLSADKTDMMKDDKAEMMKEAKDKMKDAKSDMTKGEKSGMMKEGKDNMMKDGMKMEEKAKAKMSDSKMTDEKKK